MSQASSVWFFCQVWLKDACVNVLTVVGVVALRGVSNVQGPMQLLSISLKFAFSGMRKAQK